MRKPVAPASAKSGPVSKPLGRAKAVKFGEIEGMTLNQIWVSRLLELQNTGLRGNALCAALTAGFGDLTRK